MSVPISSPFVPVPAGVLVPELRTARENARLETGPQRGRNSHQISVLGIYDLHGLCYGRTELLVADMRLLAHDPSGPHPPCGEVPVNGHIRTASAWKSRINYLHSPPNQVQWARGRLGGQPLGAILCWSPGARFNGTMRR